MLKRIEYKIFNHVRRNGNRAADFLANWGCKERDNIVDNQWAAVRSSKDWVDLATIINEDHEQATNENTRINAMDR